MNLWEYNIERNPSSSLCTVAKVQERVKKRERRAARHNDSIVLGMDNGL